MEQIFDGAAPQALPVSPSEAATESIPSPLHEVIELSRPAAYADSFRIGSGCGPERVLELRIGRPGDYIFARVRSGGMSIELSSGLCHGGAQSEAWHGVSSGESVRGPLLLICSLRFDGAVFRLDLRVKSDDAEGDTLIYGSSRMECASLGDSACVQMREVTEDDEGLRVPGVESVAVPANGNGGNQGSTTGNGNGNGNGSADGPGHVLLPGHESRVRFCESDHWYECEAPAPVSVRVES